MTDTHKCGAAGCAQAARGTHPGRILQRELDERGWTQKALAEKMGRPAGTVNAICRGKKGITAQTALQLADVLGTSAELWLDLDSLYRLHQGRVRSSGGWKTNPVAEMHPLGSNPELGIVEHYSNNTEEAAAMAERVHAYLGEHPKKIRRQDP